MESFLIVDDERLMRDTLQQLLRKEGYDVVAASDGYEAIEQSESRPFDFIICDVRMPSIDGIETIRRVKEVRPRIRSIIITGFASQETPVKAIKLGVDDYIFKPFELEEFLHSIKRNVLKLRLETENVKLHQRVAEAKERLERIINNINEGLLLVDQEFKPSLVNEGFENIYETDKYRLLENRCYEVLFQKREVCEDCPLKGGDFKERRITLRIGGKRRTLWIDGLLIEHQPGFREMVHVVRDITDWENLRREKARSEKLAAVGQLAAGVAHEIRNPLGAINTAIGVLKRSRTGGGDDDEIFEIMASEIVRVNLIIEQFLEFARPKEPDLRPIDLNELAGATVKLLSAQVPMETKAQIRFAGAKNIGLVNIDQDQIKQVVWNLVNNAIQSLDGKGEVRIELARTEDARGEWAVIQVRDNGPGIDPEVRERLFEPFFTTRRKGTGLGLAITQRIIESHGGRIELDSEPGGGAVFSVFLPIE